MQLIGSMMRYRSILSLILVVLVTLLVSCSSPTTAKVPPTYTPAQVQQIQQYVPDLLALRDRMKTIPSLVQRKDWIDVSNFVHGPLGEMRLTMTYISRNLLPQDQKKARELVRDFFDNLVRIDQAAQLSNARNVTLNYREALADVDGFIRLLPQPIQDE